MPRLATLARKHPDLAAVLLLLSLPLLVFGRALLPGRMLSAADNVALAAPWAGVLGGVAPANPRLFDVTFLFHPAVIYGAEEIRAGRFPLWNPHVFGGAPFFANPQTALLFPLTALAYVLPVALALTLMSALKLSVAGIGMYWFLRRLDVGRLPALVGAVTFEFNALLATWLQWSNTGPVALLPALFGATELLRERRGARPVAFLALLVALGVFAGYPQRVVYGLLVLAAWAVYRCRDVMRPVDFLARWGGGVALGLLLAAVQLLPFAEYARASAVLAYREDWMPYVPLPPRAAIVVLMPHFFGSDPARDFWGPANLNEISLSVGLVPWLVLPAALLAGWSRTGTKFFAALAAGAAALVYGAPLAGAALAGLPPLRTTIIVRTADLFVFSLSVLAGLGLDALRRAVPARARALAAGTRAAFTLLALAALACVASHWELAARAHMRAPLWAQYLWFLALLCVAALLVLRLLHARDARLWAALGAVQLAGLLPLAVTYNPVIDTRLLYPGPPPVVAHLRAESARDHGRVLFATAGAANFGTIFRLHEWGGYDGMTPRRIEQLADPVGSLDSYASGVFRPTVAAGSPVFDLLGIRHVVLAPGSPSPAPQLALEYDGPDAVVYRNAQALPRAFVVSKARTCLDDAATLALLHGGRIDVRHEVVVAGCEGVPAVGPTDDAASATIRSAAPGRVVVEATTGAPAYLVLADAWFPGWRAWVDGAEQTVWRADHALRAVWLPPGRHRVEFGYAPASFRYGLVVSGAAALVVAGLLWAPARRRLGGAALAAALATCAWPAAAEARLPAAPFTLELTPSALTEGGNLALRVGPVDAVAARAAEPVDVYVSVLRDGARGWIYLTTSGAFSATPAAYLRAPAGRPLGGLHVTLQGVGPASWYLFRVQFVRASAAQPTRKHYVLEPLLATARVEPRSAGDSPAPLALAAVGLLTLGALALVWLVPARPAADA